jgi:hypothetical protein
LAALAIKANPHMWKYLTGAHEFPEDDDVELTYRPRSPEEAALFALGLAPVWFATPGAAEWLRSCARTKKAGKPGSPRGKPVAPGDKPPSEPRSSGSKPAPPGKPRAGRKR